MPNVNKNELRLWTKISPGDGLLSEPTTKVKAK